MNLDDETPQDVPNERVETLDDNPGDQPVEATEDETPVFTFDGENADEDQPDDSHTLRTVRDKLRQEQREKAELRKKLEALENPKPEEIGAKPTLESCGYDEDQFEQELTAWHGKKQAQDAKRTAAEQERAKAQEAWANRLLAFEAKAKELAIPKFEEVARAVADEFGDDPHGQQAKAALVYADDPRLIAALNASPAKLAELVAMKTDPLALAIAIGELKGKVRSMSRRNPPPPEQVTRGGAPVAAASDAELARLEKEADRTGDRSAVMAYRRKQRQQAA